MSNQSCRPQWIYTFILFLLFSSAQNLSFAESKSLNEVFAPIWNSVEPMSTWLNIKSDQDTSVNGNEVNHLQDFLKFNAQFVADEICDNGFDDDGDGLVDCDDPDCFSADCISCLQDGLSFADLVVSYDPTCENEIGPTFDNPNSALGTPDWMPNGVSGTGSVSLGNGGSVSLQFSDNRLTNSGTDDPDVWIFEIGPAVEASAIELRPDNLFTENALIDLDIVDDDNDGFYPMGDIQGATAFIDVDEIIPGYAQGLLVFDAIKITDDVNDENLPCANSSGADIDAVCALSSIAVVDEICGNGIDDDGDGLVDCEDDDLMDDCCCFEAPMLEVEGNTSFCPGSSTLLSATSGFDSYLWNTGETTQSITVVTQGVYSVTAIDECMGSQDFEIFISEEAVLTPTIVGSQTICDGQSITLSASEAGLFYAWSTGETQQSITITSAGVYSLVVTDTFGCVGSSSIEVTEVEVENIQTDIVQCDGTTYVWPVNGQSYIFSGVYVEETTSAEGCIQTNTLNLNFLPVENQDLSVSICAGEVYTVEGQDFSETGFYEIPTDVGGSCPGQINLSLTVLPGTSEDLNVSICAGDVYTVEGQNFSEAGLYTIPSNAGGSCPGQINLNLTVLPTSSTQEFATICEGESFVFNGVSYVQQGAYQILFENAAGCDSLVMLELLVEENVELSENYSIYTGESVEVNGISYSEEGQYSQTLSSGPCDTVLIINVTEIKSLLYYDFNNCSAMIGIDNFDYSEFQPLVDSLACADIVASSIYRDNANENIHSCTPGLNNSMSMCISSNESCVFEEGADRSAKLSIDVNPEPGASVSLSRIRFYQNAPINFDWIDGADGLNNYPLLFGVRILVNGELAFIDTDLATTNEWSLVELNFDNILIQESSVVEVELLAYCQVGNGQPVSAWDLEELTVYGSCNSNESRILAGKILSRDNRIINDVKVVRYGEDDEVSQTINEKGEYIFDYSFVGKDYEIKAYKNSDHLNGVSTLDLMKIQRHILGLEQLPNATNFIAADVNDDKRISGLDLIQIRKLILGIYAEFPENTSYKFIDSESLVDATTPWTIPEYISLEGVDEDELNLDFTAIKIGDVDNSFTTDNVGNRSANFLDFYFEKDTNENKIDFYLETDLIHGMQFSLNLDELKIDRLASKQINLEAHNYNIGKSTLNLSWANRVSVPIEKDKPLFTIYYLSGGAADLELNSKGIKNLLYPNLESEVELKLVDRSRENIKLSRYVVAPNPFTEAIEIEMFSDENTTIKYEVYNLIGSRVATKSVSLSEGINRFEIQGQGLGEAGVYFLNILDGTERNTIKIVYAP